MHHVPESLPLFTDLEPTRKSNRTVRNRQVNRHLLAARRLSRAVRKLPDHSEEQTRAGQAICRHLIALVEEQVDRETGGPDKLG